MYLESARNWGAKKLKLTSPTPFLDAEILLASVLKKDREFVLTWPKKKLNLERLKIFKTLIDRRSHFEPIAYLIKNKEFYGLNFYVDKRVLIPRPETELLVMEAINFAERKKIKIADLGTGAGNVAITLKKYLPQTKIWAIDKSSKALIVAQKNAQQHQVKINFIKSDLFGQIKKPQFDLIVANLPYLSQEQKNKILRNPLGRPLCHEPVNALFAGRRGLALYQKLFKQIKTWPKPPQLFLGELEPNNIKAAKTLAQKLFSEAQIIIKKDWAEKNRILIIQF